MRYAYGEPFLHGTQGCRFVSYERALGILRSTDGTQIWHREMSAIQDLSARGDPLEFRVHVPVIAGSTDTHTLFVNGIYTHSNPSLELARSGFMYSASPDHAQEELARGGSRYIYPEQLPLLLMSKER